MREGEDIFVSSVGMRGELISLSNLFKEGVITDRVTGLHITFGLKAIRPGDLARLANTVFGTRLTAREIYPSINSESFDERDLFFAEQFSKTLIPRFACFNLYGAGLDDNLLAIWASSVLVPKDHPLSKAAQENAAIFFTNPALSYNLGARTDLLRFNGISIGIILG